MRWSSLSWIQPLLEGFVEALEHFRVAAFEVGELIPLGGVVGFAGAFDFGDEFFDEAALVRMGFAEMGFAGSADLGEAIFGADAHEGEGEWGTQAGRLWDW